jgi:hypothetical protein
MGRSAASVNTDRTPRVWDMASGQGPAIPVGNAPWAATAFGAAANRLIARSSSGEIVIFDIRDLEWVRWSAHQCSTVVVPRNIPVAAQCVGRRPKFRSKRPGYRVLHGNVEAGRIAVPGLSRLSLSRRTPPRELFRVRHTDPIQPVHCRNCLVHETVGDRSPITMIDRQIHSVAIVPR